MSILTDITSSFYNPAFYADVAHARRGIGMKFIFTVTIITVLLLTGWLMFYSTTLSQIAAEAPQFAKDLPALTIKGGKLSIDKPSPYSLPIGKDEDRVWVMIDTNYKVSDLNTLREFMEKNKIIMLATADEYITVKRHDRLEISSFRDFKKDITITHQDWATTANFIVEKGVQFLIIATFLFSFVVLLIYNLIATFIGALIMLIISLITRAHLEFGACMRLSAAARMPYSAIVAAPMMMGGAALTGIVAWLIWLGYFVFAAVGSKRQAA